MRARPDSNAKPKPKPKAHVRALRWLSRRDYSALELRARLEAEEYSSHDIEQALEWLDALVERFFYLAGISKNAHAKSYGVVKSVRRNQSKIVY